MRDAAGSVKLLGTNLLGEFNPALGASADIALNAVRNLKGLGLGLAATGAAAGVASLALGLYVKSVREGIEAQVQLAQAQKRGDFEAVAGQIEKTSDAMERYAVNARLANTESKGVRDGFQAIVAFWSNQFGPSVKAMTKQLEEQRAVAAMLWKEFKAPQLVIEGLKRSAAETEAMGQAAQKAAEDTISYSAATDMLVKAKEKAADAEKQSIELEIKRLDLDLDNKLISEAEHTDRLADAKERLGQVEARRARERTTTVQDSRREFAEREAQEIEHTQKMVSFGQQRRDAIVQTLGQVVDIEAATNLSLEETYRARFALQAESTKNAIDALEEETAARREALQARLGGATGQERVKIERELTQLTQEHETKRTEIEGRSLAERLRLYRQAQQEKIALQERIFAIERSLGERQLHDDLARQSAIAAGARAGSQTQLKALEAVAQQVKALSEQAKQFVNEALSAQDALARKAGTAAPEFVSKESLAQAAAERLTQLEEAQRTFTMGGQIRREDVQALAGGELGRLQQQKAAGQREIAGVLGRGPGFGPALGATADPATAFAEQINLAFEKPIDTFTTQVGPAFASMVSKANPQFEEMANLWGKAVDQMVKKAEDGSSKMGEALYQNFSRRFVKDLEREIRTF